jgi:hypothetical protein
MFFIRLTPPLFRGGVFHAVSVSAYFNLAAFFVGAASSRDRRIFKKETIAAGSRSHTLKTTHSGQNNPRIKGPAFRHVIIN